MDLHINGDEDDENGIVNMPAIRKTSGDISTPPRITGLNKQKGVRAQIAKVYKAAATGQLDPSAASKLVYCLHTLSKVIEVETLETRVEELEKIIEVKHDQWN